jgi:hypothetical protein
MTDVHADACRDTRKGEYREEPRQAPKRKRKPQPNPERGEHSAEKLERAVRRDRRAEHASAERGEAEACNALSTRLRNEQ